MPIVITIIIGQGIAVGIDLDQGIMQSLGLVVFQVDDLGDAGSVCRNGKGFYIAVIPVTTIGQ